MSLKNLMAGTALATALTLPTVAAADMMIEDAYARASGAMAQSGAAFMMITNETGVDDTLVAGSSDVAQRIEMHTHIVDGDVMRMREIEGGIELPAGETVMLERGGLHVMFMGLTRPLETGDEVEVTLTFENAGDMVLTIPVDNERAAEGHGMGDHDHSHDHDHDHEHSHDHDHDS